MNPKLLAFLRCPQSGEKLILEDAIYFQDQIQSGRLVSENGNFHYPVHDFIPQFVTEPNYADSFGFQWKEFPKTQLDSYSGFPISENRFYEVTKFDKDLSGEIILEVGSGAGRFTEIILKTGTTLFSCDYSDAVDANFENNGSNPNLCLFKASVYSLPFLKKSFNKVICLGVLQHTPDPAESFRKLAEMVKEGGELVIDVYSKKLFSLISWKYILRPITKRMPARILFRIVKKTVPILLPVVKLSKKIGGRFCARLFPIVEYSYFGLPEKINLSWAILDTFDMYSPLHDHPQSLKTVKSWFSESGFSSIVVQYGPNGIVGRGKKL